MKKCMYSDVRTKVVTPASVLCTSATQFSFILKQSCAHPAQVHLYVNFGSDFTVAFIRSAKATHFVPTHGFKPFVF